ncbi:MAG: GIY-YIG nuclease family protein [Acidobacteria bacterium]|nr:GIY-YIG nuclease family protein [Acidobacteriota bacterium]
MPYVYILRCGDGSLYTGVAKDPARREAEHAAGKGGRYTRSHLPVELVWKHRVRTWRAALREEHRIKHLARAAKLALVGPGVPPNAYCISNVLC